MTERVFVYGTLRPGRASARLLGEAEAGAVPAVLPDHALHSHGLPYPFVVAEAGSAVLGDLVEIADVGVLALLDEYEGSDYVRARVVVEADGGAVEAWVYVAAPHVALGPGSREPSGEWSG